MNILIVSQYFYPENFKVNDFAVEMLKRGHTVTVLTGLPNYPAGKWFDGYGLRSIGMESWNGIQIIRVPLIPRFSSNGIQLAFNYMSFLVSASILGPLMCRSPQDVVFVYGVSPFTVGIPAAIMRYLKRAPMWFWLQDLWPESLSATGAVKSPFILSLVGKMVRYIYNRCDWVLVQSKGFIEPAVAAGANKDRMTILPNWAEDFYKPLNPEGLSEEQEALPTGFNIVFAGNMGAAQSLETIVEAANLLKDLPEINWIMIGDGRRRAWMQKEVDKLGLADSVSFLGRLPAEQMPRYFAVADVLLATLTAEPIFSMTIPAKVQSYMACGKPLLVALDGVGNEIVNESDGGMAVAAGDGHALAESAKQLYEMTKSERDRMGEASLNYYRNNFDKDDLINRVEAHMLEVTGSQQ